MAKFKVRFTETRTYVHEEVVEAENRTEDASWIQVVLCLRI